MDVFPLPENLLFLSLTFVFDKYFCQYFTTRDSADAAVLAINFHGIVQLLLALSILKISKTSFLHLVCLVVSFFSSFWFGFLDVLTIFIAFSWRDIQYTLNAPTLFSVISLPSLSQLFWWREGWIKLRNVFSLVLPSASSSKLSKSMKYSPITAWTRNAISGKFGVITYSIHLNTNISST